MTNEQTSDPFAKGGPYHNFWWTDRTSLSPGLHFRRRRILAWPFSVWWGFRRTYKWWPN